MRAALLRVPQTVLDNHNVALSSSEVNFDQDTAASGSAQLLLHPSGDTMGAYNPYGHFVGQLTLRRLHHLGRRFLASQQSAQSSSTQSSMISPGDVHDLLVAHGVQRAQPHGRPAPMRTRRWLPLDGVATALRSVVPSDREWFSSALAVSHLCAAYASRTQHDATFGALLDAFKHQWIGSGLINPRNSCAENSMPFDGRCNARRPRIQSYTLH